MNTVDRLKCPACGLPTIPDDGHNTPDMALCNFCYEQEGLKTMNAYTKGPWSIYDDGPGGSDVILAHINGDNYDIAYISNDEIDGRPENERAANARLIASAPDLLQMVRNLVDLASVRGRLDDYKALIADARSLIAKAEGRD